MPVFLLWTEYDKIQSEMDVIRVLADGMDMVLKIEFIPKTKG